MSRCLPCEIPCGLKVSRLSQQIAAATEKRRLLCNSRTGYWTSIFYMLYIFLLSTDQNTGGLSIIHQSASECKVVTDDKN